MADRDARTLLATLAGTGATNSKPDTDERSAGEYHDRVERAIAASADLAAASEFLANFDLDGIERAVDRAEDDLCARATEGRDALETLRSLERAAGGTTAGIGDEAEPEVGGEFGDTEGSGRGEAGCDRQFQSGRSSHLGSDDIAAGR